MPAYTLPKQQAEQINDLMALVRSDAPTMDDIASSKVVTMYLRNLRLWIAYRVSAAGDQIGGSGYGPTKALAIADLQP